MYIGLKVPTAQRLWVAIYFVYQPQKKAKNNVGWMSIEIKDTRMKVGE